MCASHHQHEARAADAETAQAWLLPSYIREPSASVTNKSSFGFA
jgi:hypothetical protein